MNEKTAAPGLVPRIDESSLSNGDAAPVVDIHDRIMDAYYGRMGEAFMRKTQERIHWVCAQAQGSLILDVGCSQGIAPILLGREGKTVVGVDSDPAAINVALDYLAVEPDAVQKRVTFMNGDFMSCDFAGRNFDAVIMSEVLEHLVNPGSFVEVAASFLREEGRLIVTVPFGINDFIDHKQTFYLFEPYKMLNRWFDVVDVKIFGRWIGLVGSRRKTAISESAAAKLDATLLRLCESAFYDIERQAQDDLVSARSRLDDVNKKYRTVTEQVATLKQKSAQEIAARQETESRFTEMQARADKASQLQATLEGVRAQLEAANLKYRDSTQRYEELKVQLAAASQSLAEERKARQAQDAVLTSELRAQVQATQSVQIQFAKADAALEGVRAQLDAANLKYRESTLRYEELKVQLAAASQSLAEERKARQVQEATLAAELRVQVEATHAAQVQLANSAATLEGLRGQLDAASLKHRESTQRHDELKEQLVKEADISQALNSRVTELQVQLVEERNARQVQEATLAGELLSRTQDVHEARAQIARAVDEASMLRGQLDAANLKYRDNTQRYASVKEQLAQSAAAHATVTAQVEKLKLDMLKGKQSLSKAGRDIERLHNEKQSVEAQVAKTRAMLSFQLGYALIHGFKSVKGFLHLPVVLWCLFIEARRRRELIAAKASHPLPLKGPASPTVAVANKKALPEPVAELIAEPEPMPKVAVHATEQVSLAQRLKQLRVACIMDEFTFSSYRPEGNLLQLSPAEWERELAEFKPELLFIESAWRGKDDLWGSKVGHLSQEVQGVLAWCRAHQVPTVFWNKEDPVHFETFMNTARLFDHVFTSDIDCIHRYKAALGHERVYLLPFAAQPEQSNPIEKYERKNAFCFAGAYYVRYPERTADLGNFVHHLAEYRGVEIYDRNYGKDDSNYKFPEEYQPFIVGNLPFDQIDKAYKGYRYAINLNSIKQSQSMFARRVFELLASNTVTVSNFSRGVRLLFGDLVVTSDSGEDIVRRVDALGRDESRMRKFRLAGLRKVMMGHTYQDRFAYIFSKVQGGPIGQLLPGVVVTAHAANQQEFDTLLGSYRRQLHAARRCLVVVPEGFTPAPVDDASVQVLQAGTLGEQTLGERISAGDYVVGMTAEDYYGPNYLLDMVLATRYSQALAIGKFTHHSWSMEAGLSLVQPDFQYREVASLPVRCAMVRVEAVADVALQAWLADLQTRTIDATGLLSIDEFNYCRNGSGKGFDPVAVDDLSGLDAGLSPEALIGRAERIPPAEASVDEAPVLDGSQLATYFKPPANRGYRLKVQGSAWEAESTLADGKHDYLYAVTDLSPAELGFKGDARFHLDVSPGLNVQLVLLFLDAQKQRISHVVKTANRNQEAPIPVGTEWIRLGLRIYGGGSARINGLVLGHRPLRPAEVLGRAEHLVLTNHYPSYDDLYRNGFVHTRVAAYAECGVKVDVFRLRKDEALSYHEFRDVDVITGSQEALHKLLKGSKYKSVLVHFLDEAMWQVLQHYPDIKIFVWVHGADIRPWHRLEFNYESSQEIDAAKLRSETRMAFWRGLLRPMPENLKLIFVSRCFAEEVMEDVGFQLPEDRYEIIHNPINTDFFAYTPKTELQRKKILSVRPYASRTYANDLSVKAILELSGKPYFKELEFRMIGDGKLFDETVEPLRQFSNVLIEKRFLTHGEIAALHSEYGVFLCPTRMDSQGVSRDEAMSSGLVPVTSRVSAVPEFVDVGCAILAEPEDATGLAIGIARLVDDPALFLKMSEAAARRVRGQSGSRCVVAKEMDLFKDLKSPDQ